MTSMRVRSECTALDNGVGLKRSSACLNMSSYYNTDSVFPMRSRLLFIPNARLTTATSERHGFVPTLLCVARIARWHLPIVWWH